MSMALTRLKERNPSIFARTLRDSKVFNNGTEGIDCQAEPVVPWQHGDSIIKELRKVRNIMGQTYVFLYISGGGSYNISH